MSSADLLPALQARFPQVQVLAKTPGQARGDEPYLAVPADTLVGLCQFLRDDSAFRFDSLWFVTAVDWKTHFELVYFLFSTTSKGKLVLKTRIESRDNPEVPSVFSIWPAADWQERELYDLMGIRFAGHPNLRRLLLPDSWEGHPLRKDYVHKADRYD